MIMILTPPPLQYRVRRALLCTSTSPPRERLLPLDNMWQPEIPPGPRTARPRQQELTTTTMTRPQCQLSALRDTQRHVHRVPLDGRQIKWGRRHAFLSRPDSTTTTTDLRPNPSIARTARPPTRSTTQVQLFVHRRPLAGTTMTYPQPRYRSNVESTVATRPIRCNFVEPRHVLSVLLAMPTKTPRPPPLAVNAPLAR